MRKFIVVILIVFISASSWAQRFNNSSSKKNYIGDIKNRTYIRIGFATPAWKYYGYKDASELMQSLNIESKIGANFEIGTIYTINKLRIARGVRLGINVDYLSLKAHVFNLPGSENLYNLFIGSKVGPSLTIKPEEGLSFDIYAKLNPVWIGGVYYNKQDFEQGLDSYLGYVQFMYSFGVNVKLAVFIVGFEYEFGSMKVKNNAGDYWGNASDPASERTPMPGFNLTIGLCF